MHATISYPQIEGNVLYTTQIKFIFLIHTIFRLLSQNITRTREIYSVRDKVKYADTLAVLT